MTHKKNNRIGYKEKLRYKLQKGYVDTAAKELRKILDDNGLGQYTMNHVDYQGLFQTRYPGHLDFYDGERLVYSYNTDNIFKGAYPISRFAMAYRAGEWIFDRSHYKELKKTRVRKPKRLDKVIEEIVNGLNKSMK